MTKAPLHKRERPAHLALSAGVLTSSRSARRCHEAPRSTAPTTCCSCRSDNAAHRKRSDGRGRCGRAPSVRQRGARLPARVLSSVCEPLLLRGPGEQRLHGYRVGHDCVGRSQRHWLSHARQLDLWRGEHRRIIERAVQNRQCRRVYRCRPNHPAGVSASGRRLHQQRTLARLQQRRQLVRYQRRDSSRNPCGSRWRRLGLRPGTRHCGGWRCGLRL